MLRVGQTWGTGQAAGCVWECGEPFYGTRVGPGWYQSGAGVAGGVQTAILSIANAYASHPNATLTRPTAACPAWFGGAVLAKSRAAEALTS
jgi:hypothetical protein